MSAFFRSANEDESSVRLHAIVDHALDSIITTSVEGFIESFNEAAEHMFGYEAAEVIGKKITMLMPEPHASAHDGYMARYRETGKATIIGVGGRELTALRKDGSLFPIELAIISFRIGGTLHFSGTIRDISERKQHEEERARYLAELERSNQELDEFAHIVSHDLKEPLRGLFNHAQFLQEDYGEVLGEEGKRRLLRLSQLSQRMEQLVNDLLYFARLGRGDLAIQVTDMNRVVFEIGQMMESFLKERNARVSIPASLPSVVCDKPRVTEVLRNLITNAVKYNDKPEPVVEIGYLDTVATSEGVERKVFYVKDNGIGIDPAFHRDIFRIFKRLKDDGGSGAGVGLTFVKKIVERHHGKVWLESTLGQGTTFYFNLNRAEKNHGDEDGHNGDTAAKYLAGG